MPIAPGVRVNPTAARTRPRISLPPNVSLSVAASDARRVMPVCLRAQADAPFSPPVITRGPGARLSAGAIRLC